MRRVIDKYTGYFNPWDVLSPPPDLDGPDGSEVDQVGEIKLGKLFDGKVPQIVVSPDEFARD